MSVCLSICPPACLSSYLSVYQSVGQSVSRSVGRSVGQKISFVCCSNCRDVFHYYFSIILSFSLYLPILVYLFIHLNDVCSSISLLFARLIDMQEGGSLRK